MVAVQPEWKTTADEIWAMLKENARQMEETDRRMKAMSEETDRRMKAMSEETDRRMKETDRRMKETDRQMKETDKRVGEITGRLGDMVEHMVVPNLVAKFQKLNFTFTRVSRDVKITDGQNRTLAEIDAFLENGGEVMAVEIKTKTKISDIDDHVERMKKLRLYADAHDDKRKYLGAVAGVVFDDSVKNYALRNGFYVLEPSGETFIITCPKDKGYTSKEW
ncbi:MAG: hypothetical protein LBF83_06190 [Spirochaetaceae bacterium]|nr:hypothetical protein [Spirochaetaceae bacterium]